MKNLTKMANGKPQNREKYFPFSIFHFSSSVESGFTLIELVITVVVLSVLALGTIPLVQNAVRRQKEQQLRETLREIRLAIDEFRAEAIDNPRCAGNQQAAPLIDPRRRVTISDCKIFEASKDNPDRYPPTLAILVEGVDVLPRNLGFGQKTLGGRGFDNENGATGTDPNGATGNGNATEPKKKFYLREMPVDPITGEPFGEENFRSSSQEKDAPWDGNNVFDVHSSAAGETLDGIKYKDL